MSDDRGRTVPLPDDEDGDDGETVIEQEATGAETVEGGGEFPSPSTPPTGPSPG